MAGRLTRLFMVMAFSAGLAVDLGLGTSVDTWVHDSALVFQARTDWPHVAIVVLDDRIPIHVGRKQTLPMFALASERLLQAGVNGVFLDARLTKEQEMIMPYALCLEPQGRVRWSEPQCRIQNPAGCALVNSPAGAAPLRMDPTVIGRFKVAPYLLGQEQLPDFLLYGWEAAAVIPASGLVASDRLVSRQSPIMRWMDLSPDHAIVQLATWADSEQARQSLAKHRDNERCDRNRPCRRVRLSSPIYQTQIDKNRMIVPLSALAGCDAASAMETARALQGKVVILQMTFPSEGTDMIVTPMTTAWLGPHLPTPGSQFLADAIETLLLGDHPRPPPLALKLILFLGVAIVSVAIGRYRGQPLLWTGAAVTLIAMVGLCFVNRLIQLWPVVAVMTVYLTGAFEVIGLNMVIGFREGKLIKNYMPDQIHELLISLRANQRFRNQRNQAIVLMSDLTNYTTVTSLLKDPAYVLELMNDYFEETSLVLQKKYGGWLESYVGDMVCYYWPVLQENPAETFQNALQGALEMARLQQRFFATVHQRYAHRFPADALTRVATLIDAGIGLACGDVVMGELGPKHGVRKFGILGDPLNLASRLESLTRLFNTDIIACPESVEIARSLGIRSRRLGRVAVKGRLQPVDIHALGSPEDPRFRQSDIQAWEQWLGQLEQGLQPTQACPESYRKDQETLLRWRARGLLTGGGVWCLDEK